MQKIPDALQHCSQYVPNTAITGLVWRLWRFTWFILRRSKENMDLTMDFLKHEFSQAFNGLSSFRYRGNEMWHFKALLQWNAIRLILLITTTAHIIWLFVISLQDPFYLALPPKKRHLWALPEATDVNPNQTDNYLINLSFFTPCSHCAIANVKSQIIFLF